MLKIGQMVSKLEVLREIKIISMIIIDDCLQVFLRMVLF
jgi:hypothetical protein